MKTYTFMICAKKYSLESCLKVLSSDMLGVPIGQAVGLPATYRTVSFLRAIWHVRETYGRIYIPLSISTVIHLLEYL
jgi:hypothetical protein